MDQLEELLRLLEQKLEAVRHMIDSYEEGMDYATHCTLQGFAEGLVYVVEEIRCRLA